MRDTTLYWAYLGASGTVFDALKSMTATLTAAGFPALVREQGDMLRVASANLGECTFYADEQYGILGNASEDPLRSTLILGLAAKQSGMLVNTSSGQPCSCDVRTRFLRAQYPDIEKTTLLRLMAVCGLIGPNVTALDESLPPREGDVAPKVCF